MAGQNSSIFSLSSKLYLLIFINLFLNPLIECKNGGFSTHLIHRDTPTISTFHDPSSSKFERLNNAFLRSFSRAEYFKKRISNSQSDHALDSSSEPIQSHITLTSGEYLMKASVGTPPVDILAIADTGSDLTWIQCKPCDQCYKQDAPLFDPRKTSSYRKVSCDSQLCMNVGSSSCDDANNCGYTIAYGDRSYSSGDLSAETFTFGSSSGKNISIPRVFFGCGHQNDGNFQATASGIIGLGGGLLSIVKQLSESIGDKFSYCLVPTNTESNVSSKINFGKNAVVSGPNAVSTPLIKKSQETFYYLTLEGISVGNTRILNKGFSKLGDSNYASSEEGNIIIDSGTTLTFIPREFYQELESKLEESIRGKRVSDPQGLLGLCYKLENDLKLPNLVVHFTDADIVLPPTNTFRSVSKGVICLVIAPADVISIYGNLFQQNFLVGYDLENEKLSFLPTDCTKN